MNPPIRGQEYIFYIDLPSQANTKIFQVNPTLASGDAKVSKDGGAEANLNTLPAVTPAGGTAVKVVVSASEMDSDNVKIKLHDAAGDEWCDVGINIQPSGLGTPGTVNDASATTTSFVTALTEATDDHYKGSVIVFTDGVLQGQARKITAYNGTTKAITVAALTDAPGNGDPFVILGRVE